MRILLAAICVALCGCTSLSYVDLERFPADGVGKARVTTQDGYTYEFERVAVTGDTLTGTYNVVEEKEMEEGQLAYVDVERHTRLPLGRVASVEIKRIDYGNSVLLGAGAVLMGIWVKEVLATDDSGDEDSGKPPINP